ncbi:MAG TPA: hypothetical protein VGD67_23240 [Pseudonocardiaceae bacterium]
MTLSELVNRVIAALVLAALTGIAAAVLMSQARLMEDASIDHLTEGPDPGSLITGGTVDPEGRQRPGFVVTELPDRSDGALRWVRIDNPNSVPITVTRLAVVVGTPPAGTGCLAGDLRVDSLPLPVVVPARAWLDIALGTRLTESAPAACGSVRFPMTYAGLASTR